MSALVFAAIMAGGLSVMFRYGRMAVLPLYDVRRAPGVWWRP